MGEGGGGEGGRHVSARGRDGGGKGRTLGGGLEGHGARVCVCGWVGGRVCSRRGGGGGERDGRERETTFLSWAGEKVADGRNVICSCRRPIRTPGSRTRRQPRRAPNPLSPPSLRPNVNPVGPEPCSCPVSSPFSLSLDGQPAPVQGLQARRLRPPALHRPGRSLRPQCRRRPARARPRPSVPSPPSLRAFLPPSQPSRWPCGLASDGKTDACGPADHPRRSPNLNSAFRPANLRCGEWYVPPDQQPAGAPQAYFKSTGPCRPSSLSRPAAFRAARLTLHPTGWLGAQTATRASGTSACAGQTCTCCL